MGDKRGDAIDVRWTSLTQAALGRSMRLAMFCPRVECEVAELVEV